MLDAQVGVQLGIGQIAHGDAGLDVFHLRHGGRLASVEQAQGRMEHGLAPAHGLQLLQGVGMVARLADLRAIQGGDLVGADDEAARVAVEHGLRLGLGQAQGRGAGAFTGQGAFVEIGHGHLERQAQALQQFLAVGRTRCKNQAQWGGSWYHSVVDGGRHGRAGRCQWNVTWFQGAEPITEAPCGMTVLMKLSC